MKRTSKHGKETAKLARQPAFKTPEEQISAHLASTGLFNPLSIALATGAVRPVLPRGRPQRKATRDAQIVQMKDAQGYTFGQIARKLNIGREVALAAYYRMRRKRRQGETKFR